MPSRREKPPANEQPAGRKKTASNPFLELLAVAKPQVEQRLDTLFARELKQRAKLGREVETVLTETRALSSRGGKRLRAGLVLAGQIATEKRAGSWETALEVGVAVELMQAYFLIHDDWMDQDDTRRGGPSVHAALAKQFRSPHLGACGAVLGGDYLMALATGVLNEATRDHKKSVGLMREFVDMQIAAVLGQQLDVIQLSKDLQSKNPLRAYELKTGIYTVSGPLRLGALLSGAKSPTLLALEQFAKPLGIAFQLRDDLLNLFADPKQTGKPHASDLKTGKWTWTLSQALEHATAAQRSAVKRVFNRPGVSRQALASALQAIEDSGAHAATEAKIRELCAEAEAALSRAELTAKGKRLLAGAISALTQRGA